MLAMRAMIAGMTAVQKHRSHICADESDTMMNVEGEIIQSMSGHTSWLHSFVPVGRWLHMDLLLGSSC